MGYLSPPQSEPVAAVSWRKTGKFLTRSKKKRHMPKPLALFEESSTAKFQRWLWGCAIRYNNDRVF